MGHLVCANLKNQRLEHLFLESALTLESPLYSTRDVVAWLGERNQAARVEVNAIPFDALQRWHFDASGNLRHDSGKFFSIEGLRVETNWGEVERWTQPIIHQPEIGILGLIARELDGVLHFLVQAKIEPGNINFAQLAPTVQATPSNYLRVHNGKAPPYYEYFRADDKFVLLDQLQSEQGSRFFRKRNRNMIVLVKDELEIEPDYVWLTLGQIIELTRYDNVVNMDMRTVISGIPFSDFSSNTIELARLIRDPSVSFDMLVSCIDSTGNMYNDSEIFSWLSSQKSKFYLSSQLMPLNQAEEWTMNEREVRHRSGKFFKVIAVDVHIANREVERWTQPLVQPAQDGICGFLVKNIRGVFHFLVQAKVECGNLDVIELAPTVQCLTGGYRDDAGDVPFLEDILNAPEQDVLYRAMQSEEGGRFYHEQNLNLIVRADHLDEHQVPENYIWMTINQIKRFLRYNNYVNIQARSLIAAVSFITRT